MKFDGAFACRNGGAGVILISPKGELYYAVQLCFVIDKISNNIAGYEGLLAGLRAAIALGIKHLLIKGDSQLLVNLSNKSYKPKDDHMAAYLKRSASLRSTSGAWSSCTSRGRKTKRLMTSPSAHQEGKLNNQTLLKRDSSRHP